MQSKLLVVAVLLCTVGLSSWMLNYEVSVDASAAEISTLSYTADNHEEEAPAQESPDFPESLAIILGIIATPVISFLKRYISTENDLLRMIFAGVLSSLTGVVGALMAGIAPGTNAETTFFLGITFGFSQIAWNFWKGLQGTFPLKG